MVQSNTTSQLTSDVCAGSFVIPVTFSTLQRDRRRAPNGDDANLEEHEEIDLNQNAPRRCFHGHGNEQDIKERPKSAIPELPGSSSWKKYSMHVDSDAWAPGVKVPDCTQPNILFSRVVCSKPALKQRSPEEQLEGEKTVPRESTEGGQERVVQRRPWSAFARIGSVKSRRQPRDQAKESSLTRGEIMRQKQTSGVPDKATRRPVSAKPRLQQTSRTFADVAARPLSAGRVGSSLRQQQTICLHPGRSRGQLAHPQLGGRAYVSAAKTRRPSCGVQCGPISVASQSRRR